MRATRRIMVHVPGGKTRFVEKGAEVPPELVEYIHRPELVDAPLPHLVEAAVEAGEAPPEPGKYPEFDIAWSVEKILGWIGESPSSDEARKRSRHVWDEESGPRGRARKTLLEALAPVVGETPPGEVDRMGEEYDDSDDLDLEEEDI